MNLGSRTRHTRDREKSLVLDTALGIQVCENVLSLFIAQGQFQESIKVSFTLVVPKKVKHRPSLSVTQFFFST